MPDARINRIFEGANEVLRLFIALNGIQGPAEKLKSLGLALRAPLRNVGLVSGYAAQRVLSAAGNKDKLEVALHDSLREHVEYFEKRVAELARARRGGRHPTPGAHCRATARPQADRRHGNRHVRDGVHNCTQRLLEVQTSAVGSGGVGGIEGIEGSGE